MISTAPLSRRTLLKGTGALLVVFSIDGRRLFSNSYAAPMSTKSTRIGAWLSVNSDNTVTIFTGKSELGQGLSVAFSQIAADELDFPLDRIHIVTADTDRTPNEGYTYGSLSIQRSGGAIRNAAAEARQALRKLAASRWNVPLAEVSMHEGLLLTAGRELSYAQVLGDQFYQRQVTGKAPLKPAQSYRYVGQSIPRQDIAKVVFGQAHFIQDLRLDNMLFARIVRPPTLGSRLSSVDLAPARHMPQVVDVVRDGCFLGVIALREEAAQAAADQLSADAHWHDKAPVSLSPIISEAVAQFPHKVSRLRERTEAAPATDRLVRLQIERPFQSHASIAPSTAVALWAKDKWAKDKWAKDKLTVWSHTQGVFPLRKALAAVLGMAEDKIHVIHSPSAGCYGHNGADDAAFDAVLLARATPGRPVKLQWTRADEFQREPYGPAMVSRVEATLDDVGLISSWRFVVTGFGHSNRPGGAEGNLISARLTAKPLPLPPPLNIRQPAGGLDRNAMPLYDLPRLEVVERFIEARPVLTSALRSLGAYANVLAIESVMDALAEVAEKHPIDFRMTQLSDSRGLELLAALRKMSDEAPLRRGDGDLIGRGYGFARYKNMGAYYAALLDVLVDPTSRTVSVLQVKGIVDCGLAINPDGIRNQIEGGALQALSWTLFEEATYADGRVSAQSWASYPILTFNEVPLLETVILDRPEAKSLGVGEASQGPVAAALANAIAAATGKRPHAIPFLEGGRLRDS
ncbi:MAG: xanthine dehydrogenase family protein molybdopterin-binding subunit [Spongiibacteraceae bacterium]|nr:xanthine dehydrogenase family protein molybdopterin-binding subunit [Spongiibacteraceae bacterium]